MNTNIFGRVCRIAAAGAILFGSAACVNMDETLGENFIPTDQTWNVFPCDPEPITDIALLPSDKLSGYNSNQFVFGGIFDGNAGIVNNTSFTLVPLADSLDFGEQTGDYPEVLQFHFAAARDTVSVMNGYPERILQNVDVYALKKALDSTVIYAGSDLSPFVDLENRITDGIPVYDGGDSLSFDFSKDYAKKLMEGIARFQSRPAGERDTLKYYIEDVPGIYIKGSSPVGTGGRINMFNIAVDIESAYLMGNFAELKIRGIYDYSDEPVDTSFFFYYGPTKFLGEEDTSYPPQYALNTSSNIGADNPTEAGENIFIEGGSGLKPVIKAQEIKRIVEDLINEKGIDPKEAVINKATITLPFEMPSYSVLDQYPYMLSPTVRLYDEETGLYTYAGLTDYSVSDENQGGINRSLCIYSPDISFHVQEILKLEDEEKLEEYDVWFLIMHEEVIASTSSGSSSYSDLLYNNYYNMMYDPYGYGYGYGGYGYGSYGGYGGYGSSYGSSYGYNNYYNYYMMMQLANAANSSSTTYSSSVELDRDRFYNARLNGPEAAGARPSLKITFSAPKSAEK